MGAQPSMKVVELLESRDLSRDVKVGWDVGVEGKDGEYFHATVIDPWNPTTKSTKVKSLMRWVGEPDEYPVIDVDGVNWKIMSIMKRFAEPMTLDQLVKRGYLNKFTEERAQTLVGSMLLKLFYADKPVKVRIAGMKRTIKHPDGKKTWVSVPDQEWDVTNVEMRKGARDDKVEVRVHNTSPEEWFELLPDDDENLTIKKKDDYWLLTSRDGKGVKF